MNQVRYFQLHDLLTFSFAGEEKELNYLAKQYVYYEVFGEPSHVDLEIKIGPFSSPCRNGRRVYTVNRKYRVIPDGLYVEDCYKTAYWRVLIQGLEEKHTRVYFSGNNWSHMLLYKFIVEPILRYKLNDRGVVMIHSSSIADEAGAIVFPASPSVGKTNTMVNWLCHGKKFLGDEYTILAPGKVYGYVTPLRLHSYNLTASPMLQQNIPVYDRFQIWWRSMLLKATFGYGDITHEVPLQIALPSVRISETSTLRALILLTKANVNQVTFIKSSKDDIIKKLIIINRFETAYRFNDYFDAYFYGSHGLSTDEFWAKMKGNLEDLLKDVPCSEIAMPHVYNKDTFQKLDECVQHIETTQKPDECIQHFETMSSTS